MRRKIDSLLEEQVRPGLAAHGGNVEVIDVDNNQVFLKWVKRLEPNQF